jgi:hypothetical protein
MPFCTTCGKESAPGKKFCEYCGTPLEQPVVSPAAPNPPPVGGPPVSVSPPPVPGTSPGGSGKILVIAGIIAVLIILAGVYFIGLPMISGSSGTRAPLQQATTLPTGALTPYPASSSTMTGTFVTATNPTSSQTYEEKYTETYNLVYSVNHAFNGGQKEVFTQNLITPPLYIKFNITPKMFYGEKTVNIGLSSEHVVDVAYTSPNAWFKVQIYDADNGVLKEEQGFNKGYSIMTKQEFMVRAPGNYRVEMTGNDVTAEVQILTGKS